MHSIFANSIFQRTGRRHGMARVLASGMAIGRFYAYAHVHWENEGSIGP